MTDPLHWIGEPPALHPPGLFPGLFPDFGALLISGPKEVGKSLIALEIAHAAVTGHPLWGVLTPSHPVTKVVYIFVEHGGYGSLAQQWSYTGFDDPTHSIWVCDDLRPLVVRGNVHIPNRDFYVQAVKGASLVIFDPLAAFIQGEEGENQASPTRALINTIEYIGNSTHAATLILGHFGKPIYRQETGETVHSGTRGSSALEHAATGVFYLTKGSKGDGYQLYRLEQAYFKGDAIPKFHLKRLDDELCHTLDPNKPNPILSWKRAIAGRKGGQKGRNQYTGPLPPSIPFPFGQCACGAGLKTVGSERCLSCAQGAKTHTTPSSQEED